MYGKEFSKPSQEWLWNDANQNDSFSDFSYLFPIQCILQNEVKIATTEANAFLDLGQFNEACVLLMGSNTVTFFGRTVAFCGDAVIDCLVKWVQFTPAVDHSPALSPCLDTANLLSLFFYQFSLASLLCHEQNYLFRPVCKTPLGCQ